MRILIVSKDFSLACVIVFFGLCMIWLSSCSDDEPKDTTAPTITISNPTDNSIVWNMVNISLNAADNQSIQKIELFIDQNLVKTFTQSPFEFGWDSNTVADGEHNIKAIATDKSGNKSEIQVTLTVKNILVSIEVPAKFLRNDDGYMEKGFIFLSDESGKLIASTEVKDGKKIEFKSSVFNGEKFYLSQVIYEQGSWNESPFLTIQVFPDIERGKWVLTGQNIAASNHFETASLTFTNLDSEANYRITTNGGEQINYGSPDAVVQLAKSPSKLYIEKTPNEGELPMSYRLYPSITSGGSYSIDLNDVDLPVATIKGGMQSGDWFASVLYGLNAPGDYSEIYGLGFNSTYNYSTWEIAYPGNAFNAYYITYYLESNLFSFGRGQNSLDIEFSLPTHEYSFTISNNIIKYDAQGSYDFFVTYFGSDQTYTRWIFFQPLGSHQTLIAPELPNEVKLLADTKVFNYSKPWFYGIYTLDNIQNYDGLKTFIRNSKYGLNEILSPGVEFTFVEFSWDDFQGGRKAGSRPVKHSLREKIYTMKLNQFK